MDLGKQAKPAGYRLIVCRQGSFQGNLRFFLTQAYIQLANAGNSVSRLFLFRKLEQSPGQCLPAQNPAVAGYQYQPSSRHGFQSDGAECFQV